MANKHEKMFENIIDNGKKWFKGDFIVSFLVTKKGKIKLGNMEKVFKENEIDDFSTPKDMKKALIDISNTKKTKYIG